MIDSDGFRLNVGIIVSDGDDKVLWARRVGQDSWQFPQGGIKADEAPQEALFRELYEELGLEPACVEVVGCTRQWLKYTLPSRYVRKNCTPQCIGQKQMWFLLRMVGGEDSVCLDHDIKPEFDTWRWVHYWWPPREVIFFKRRVYWQALRELAPLLGPPVTSTTPKRPRPNRYRRTGRKRQGQKAAAAG
ncbi:MAG: RNA pyrophosphohydrolase [Gammaproteobacteria bacterium]|nr:RNA pyrophosphohydrolase [Gammaproteobacteria bacterium]